jgi:hypothetical protein
LIRCHALRLPIASDNLRVRTGGGRGPCGILRLG